MGSNKYRVRVAGKDAIPLLVDCFLAREFRLGFGTAGVLSDQHLPDPQSNGGKTGSKLLDDFAAAAVTP